jgi:hypothetical protein
MPLLEWMLVGVGFTGALSLLFVLRGLGRKLGMMMTLTTHFSPKGGCSEAIVREIGHARREVLVQAYSFTSQAIAAALVAARARGVKVEILLDRANEKDSRSELGIIEQQGIEVLIDAHHAIAHNKIIIIDRCTLITGSFNFTRQAENENAENLLILKGSAHVLDSYVENFLAHKAHCQTPGETANAAPNVRGDDGHDKPAHHAEGEHNHEHADDPEQHHGHGQTDPDHHHSANRRSA